MIGIKVITGLETLKEICQGIIIIVIAVIFIIIIVIKKVNQVLMEIPSWIFHHPKELFRGNNNNNIIIIIIIIKIY